MDNKPVKILTPYVDPSNRVIEVLVAEKNNPKLFHLISFKPDAIEYLQHINDDASMIVLKSKISIPVALAYRQLKNLVFGTTGADPQLDLTSVTGEAAKHIVDVQLADDFNSKAPPKLTFGAILRQIRTNSIVHVEFSEADVLSFEAEPKTRAKMKKSVLISFNKESKVKPFGNDEACLDMPYDDFLTYFAAAKARRDTRIDFCEIFMKNPNKYGFIPE